MKRLNIMRFVVLLLIVTSNSLLYGQSITPTVLSPAGNDFSNATFSVSTTFGEMTAVTTITGGSSIITQGFHQEPDMATSINTVQLDLEGISVYPNPTKGILTLEIENTGNENYHYYVYNVIGEVMMEKQITPGLSKIDISKMIKGVYFVQVKNRSTKQQKTIKVTLI